jgi:1-acyl-sn-glycerol-3-phosphate acyltransferase
MQSSKSSSVMTADKIPLSLRTDRSRVVVEFGKPIDMSAYAAQFLAKEEGAPKAAVKRLTKHVQEEMEKLTVNAEDWDTVRPSSFLSFKPLSMSGDVELIRPILSCFTHTS